VYCNWAERLTPVLDLYGAHLKAGQNVNTWEELKTRNQIMQGHA
jgi:hypothetical protein